MLASVGPRVFNLLGNGKIFRHCNCRCRIVGPASIGDRRCGVFNRVRHRDSCGRVLGILVPTTSNSTSMFASGTEHLLGTVLVRLSNVSNCASGLTSTEHFVGSYSSLRRLFARLGQSSGRGISVVTGSVLEVSGGRHLLTSIRSRLSLSLRFLSIRTVEAAASHGSFSLHGTLRAGQRYVVLRCSRLREDAATPLFNSVITCVLHVLRRGDGGHDSMLLLLSRVVGYTPVPGFARALGLVHSAGIPAFLCLRDVRNLGHICKSGTSGLFGNTYGVGVTCHLNSFRARGCFSSVIKGRRIGCVKFGSNSARAHNTDNSGRDGDDTSADNRDIAMTLRCVVRPARFTLFRTKGTIIVCSNQINHLRVPVFFGSCPVSDSRVIHVDSLSRIGIITRPRSFGVSCARSTDMRARWGGGPSGCRNFLVSGLLVRRWGATATGDS